MKLRDRLALVTGGGRGIGRAIALAFAREGAHVAVTARTGVELAAVAAEIRALGRQALAVPCDVAERAQVDAAVRQVADGLGAVEILVNNAGIAVSAKLLDTDDALWERHLRVNLTGAFLMTRAVLPGMLAARWGRIVNVASIAGRQGYPYIAAYAASKHGLLGLTRALGAGGRDRRRDRQRDLPRLRGDRAHVGGRPEHPGAHRAGVRRGGPVARRLLAAEAPDRAGGGGGAGGPALRATRRAA